MATYEEAMQALRAADAAGNTEDASRLAVIANKLKPAAATATPPGQIPSEFGPPLAADRNVGKPDVGDASPEIQGNEPEWLRNMTAAAAAVPAAGLAAGGVRALAQTPKAAQALRVAAQSSPNIRNMIEALSHFGKALIPSSAKELAINTAGAGALGVGMGMAKPPLSSSMAEKTGLPKTVTDPLVEAGLDAASVMGGMGAGKVLSGGNLKRATGALGESVGDLSTRMAQKARDLGFSQTQQAGDKAARGMVNAAETARKTKMLEAEHATSSAKATAAVNQATDKALEANLAKPKTKDEIGATLKDELGGAMKRAYEKRAAEATKLYGEAVEKAHALEAGGAPFAKSVFGKRAVADLQDLKRTVPGVKPLTPEQEKQIDVLIDTITGKGSAGKTEPLGAGKVSGKVKVKEPGTPPTPAGHEALVSRLRELRKVNENQGAPTEGLAALGKDKATDIAKRLEAQLYEWNPQYRAADEAYKASSRDLERFQTEQMTGALRGESFDFKKLAASPAEFGGRFFKDSQSVQQLHEATGNKELVTKVGKDWAAHQINGKDAEGAAKWATENADWLRAAGVDKSVDAYIRQAAQHESDLARLTAKSEQRADTLKGIRTGAQADLEKIGKTAGAERKGIAATREKRLAAAQGMSDKIMNTPPDRVYRTFMDQVKPEIEKSGLMGEKEIAKLEQQIKAVESTYKGYERAKKAAMYIALSLGGYVAYRGVATAL